MLEEAAEQFYWDRERSQEFDSSNFEDILNTRKTLVSTKNGVYDLEQDVFRESRCEDYISLCTELDYVEHHHNDQKVLDICEFLQQILPQEDVRNYVMRVLASCLDGTITHEHFHVWIGSGGNGKSKLIELFEKSFGRYCAQN